MAFVRFCLAEAAVHHKNCIIKRAVSVNKGMNSEFKTVVILSVLVRLNIVSRRRTPQERVY